jgi:asparagine synthase (glutamine-hydrolysing)
MNNETADFVRDVFSNTKSASREFINAESVLANFANSGRFSRKTWALLSLELWQQEFHDKSHQYRAMIV